MRTVVGEIAANQEAVRACLNLASDATPTPIVVRITMTVMPSGRIEDVVVVESSDGADAAGACVVDLVGRFEIHPAPTEPATYTFPFRYHRGTSEPEPVADPDAEIGALAEPAAPPGSAEPTSDPDVSAD